MLRADPETRKNCLKWGLRILSPEAYFTLLSRYALQLSPDAYEQIENAHFNKKGAYRWYYQWLTCQILNDKKWINLATGVRIANWHWDKVVTFLSWESYELFREELRDAVSKHFNDN
jgi:hypothetical protein